MQNKIKTTAITVLEHASNNNYISICDINAGASLFHEVERVYHSLTLWHTLRCDIKNRNYLLRLI